MTKYSASIMDVYNLIQDLRSEMNEKFDRFEDAFRKRCEYSDSIFEDYKAFKTGLIAKISLITVIISSLIMFFANEIKTFFIQRG